MSILQHYPPATETDLSLLYQRAVGDPASLSRADRNVVMRAPPPEIEDSLCRRHCGTDMAALRAKALAAPDTLIEIEARVLATGANLPTPEEARLDGRTLAAWPAARQDLLWAALDAIATPQDSRIKHTATDLCHGFRRRARAHVAAMPPGEERARAAAHAGFDGKAPWIKLLELQLERGDVEQWGFVCFRTNYVGDAWTALREKIDERAAQVLQAVRGADHVAANFRIVYVEDESALADADAETLRRRFVAMRQGGIPKGIRTDYFLSVDDTVMRLFSQRPESFELPVWEADFDAALPLADEYAGVLAMPVEKLIVPVFGEIIEDRKPLRIYHKLMGH